MISNCAIIVCLICSAMGESVWLSIPAPERQQPILWSNGQFRSEPVPPEVYTCGIGPGVVFFKKESEECPNVDDIVIPYGSANQYRKDVEHCFDAPVSLIHYDRINKCVVESRQAAFNAMGHGCKTNTKPDVAFGTVSQFGDDCMNYAILESNGKIQREGYTFCSVGTGSCTVNEYVTGLTAEKIYYVESTYSRGILVSANGSVTGLSAKTIEVTNAWEKYFPNEDTVHTGRPIGIATENYISSGIKHKKIEVNRQKRSASAFAAYVLSYAVQVRNSALAAFRVVDRNFDKTSESLNKLSQYSYEQAVIMKTVIQSVPAQMRESRLLEVKNSYILDVVEELSNKAKNLEEHTLTVIQKMQENEYQQEMIIEDIKKEVEENYPEWTVKQITYDSDEYLVRIERGSFLNTEAPNLQCSNSVCYLPSEWYHATGQRVDTVQDVYIDHLVCGVYFQGESVKRVVEAQSELDNVLRYLRQYSVPFISPTGMPCAGDLTLPESGLFRELMERMDSVNEGSVVLSPDGDFKLECAENGTLARKYPMACQNYLDHNSMYMVLDSIQPERIAFEKVAEEFEQNTEGFKALAEISKNLGASAGQVIGALAELPKAFVEGLQDWADGVDAKMTALFVLVGVNIAGLVFLYFLYLRNKVSGSRDTHLNE